MTYEPDSFVLLVVLKIHTINVIHACETISLNIFNAIIWFYYINIGQLISIKLDIIWTRKCKEINIPKLHLKGTDHYLISDHSSNILN